MLSSSAGQTSPLPTCTQHQKAFMIQGLRCLVNYWRLYSALPSDDPYVRVLWGLK
jgi:hypothetical protein